jgi:hypothetical protein
MADATVALMRVSAVAAFSAMPPQPQMPILPMHSGVYISTARKVIDSRLEVFGV